VAEIDVDNPSGELLSGAYTEVHLKVPGQTSSYLVPVSTLVFRSQGLQVAVVKDGSASLTAVTPRGTNFGDQIEIVLPHGQRIVDCKSARFHRHGQKVQVVQTAAEEAQSESPLRKQNAANRVWRHYRRGHLFFEYVFVYRLCFVWAQVPPSSMQAPTA